VVLIGGMSSIRVLLEMQNGIVAIYEWNIWNGLDILGEGGGKLFQLIYIEQITILPIKNDNTTVLPLSGIVYRKNL
jgi:hypothetical protein